jgi:gas vesicle protein
MRAQEFKALLTTLPKEITAWYRTNTKEDIQMEQNGSNGVGSVVSSFFLGGLIGAGVALLVAPKAGSEMREQIRGLAGTATKRANDYYEQITQVVASTLDSGKELLDDKKQLIANAVQAGIALYEEKLQKAKESGQYSESQPVE